MIPISENIKDWLLIYGVIYFVLNTIGGFYLKKLNKTLKEQNDDLFEKFKEASERYKATATREIYLMKSLNDAWNVVDMRGFLSQRIANAPKSFQALDENDVKPDGVT